MLLITSERKFIEKKPIVKNQHLKNDFLSFCKQFLIEYKRKIIWSILLYLLFIYTYRYTQTHINFSITTLVPSKIDLFISFDQKWTKIYLSLFVFISLGSLSISCLEDLYRYLFLFAGVYITAISFFSSTQLIYNAHKPTKLAFGMDY